MFFNLSFDFYLSDIVQTGASKLGSFTARIIRKIMSTCSLAFFSRFSSSYLWSSFVRELSFSIALLLYIIFLALSTMTYLITETAVPPFLSLGCIQRQITSALAGSALLFYIKTSLIAFLVSSEVRLRPSRERYTGGLGLTGAGKD